MQDSGACFQEGLILGGDEPSDSIVGRTSLGWAVLRESQAQGLVRAPVEDWPGSKAALLGAPRMQCRFPPDPGDPTVAVITYQWRDAEEEARPG